MRMSAEYAVILAAVLLPAGLAAADPNTAAGERDAAAVEAVRPLAESPAKPDPAQVRAELSRLIDELRSMRFRDPANPIGGEQNIAAVKQDVQTADVNSAPVEEAAQPAPQPVPKPDVQPLVQDPNTAVDPFRLAEALYRSGRYAEALASYRATLARASEEGANRLTETDRAWILFQIGNSYARTNPPEAIKAYRRLIAEHPASQWTPIAISREQLIQWYISSGVAAGLEK
ncbi:MAG TPA: tetratricopeptide repeat protein [Sedimentisphaerales bacterium]|nr:tetratricopeptide repeat protein [Sedimentisphaerales bacterium]